MLLAKLNIGTVHAKLKALGVGKLYSRFVLPGDIMQNHMESCQNNLRLYTKYGETFFANMITVDETSISMCLSETKRESAGRKFPGEKPSLKMETGTSHRQTMMLTVFWGRKGIILMDFADKNAKINSVYYSKLVPASRKEIRTRRSGFCKITLQCTHREFREPQSSEQD